MYGYYLRIWHFIPENVLIILQSFTLKLMPYFNITAMFAYNRDQWILLFAQRALYIHVVLIASLMLFLHCKSFITCIYFHMSVLKNGKMVKNGINGYFACAWV